jgi:hypothetical protein
MLTRGLLALVLLAAPARAQEAPITDKWQAIAVETQLQVRSLQDRIALLAATVADRNAALAAMAKERDDLKAALAAQTKEVSPE